MKNKWIEIWENNNFPTIGIEDLQCRAPRPANEMPDSIHFRSHIILDGMPSIIAFPSPTAQPRKTDSASAFPCTRLGSHFPCHLEPHPTAFVDYRFGLQFGYRQHWTFLGYTLGELISSISMPPNSKTKIETYTWDRYARHQETELSEDTETSSEYNTTNRDTQEIIKEVTKTSSSSASGGINVDIKVVKIGASGSAQNSVTRHNKTTSSHISEVTSKSAQKYKSTRRMKVSESHEYGSETRITKEIENTNRCYAVTYQFYEILRNYKLDLFLETVNPVIYIPYSVPEISLQFVRCYEGVIKKNLLDKSYLAAFDTIRRYNHFTDTKAAAAEVSYKSLALLIIEQYDKWAATGFPVPDNALGWIDGNMVTLTPGATSNKVRSEWLDVAIATVKTGLSDNTNLAVTNFIQSWKDYFSKNLNETERISILMISFFKNLKAYERLAELYEGLSKEVQPTIEELERDRLIDDLICHLNENKIYYLHKIWASEDVGERYLRFERYNNIFGVSLNDLIDPEPLGFFGNMGVFILKLDAPSKNDFTKYVAFQWKKWVEQGGNLEDRLSPEFIFTDDLDLVAAAEQEIKENKIQEKDLVFRFPLEVGQLLANAATAEKKQQNSWVDEDPQKRVTYTTEWKGKDNFIFQIESFCVSLFRAFAEGLKEIGKIESASQIITMPTTGIFCESMLGQCSAGEPFIEDHRRLDVASKEQEVRKQTLENDRLAARLAANMLEEPEHECPTITAKVILQKEEETTE